MGKYIMNFADNLRSCGGIHMKLFWRVGCFTGNKPFSFDPDYLLNFHHCWKGTVAKKILRMSCVGGALQSPSASGVSNVIRYIWLQTWCPRCNNAAAAFWKSVSAECTAQVFQGDGTTECQKRHPQWPDLQVLRSILCMQSTSPAVTRYSISSMNYFAIHSLCEKWK